MYKNKKVVVGCLALLVLLSVALQALPPPSTQSGRVYRYEVFIRTYKEPEDDPWGAGARFIFISSGSAASSTPTLLAGATSSVTLSARIHNTLDIFTESRIAATFTFSSATTTTQGLQVTLGGYSYTLLFIPTRAYQPGVLYRWVITIPGYHDSNLVLSSFPIVRTSTTHYHQFPLTTECSYWDGAQLKFSTSDLSTSVSITRVNYTHLSLGFVIDFGYSWLDRQVSSCSIFTSDSEVISRINSYLQSTNQRTLSGNRLYILLLSNLNIVVVSGDSIEVVAWYITTDSL